MCIAFSWNKGFSSLRPAYPGPRKTPVLVQIYIKVNFYSVKQAIDPLIEVLDAT